MLTTIVILSLIVGWFCGILTLGGAFAIIVRRDDVKKKNAAKREATLLDQLDYQNDADAAGFKPTILEYRP